MAEISTSTIKDFTRGGQTLLHFFRMTQQVFKRFMIIVFMLWAAVSIAIYWSKTTEYQRYLAVKWSFTKLVIGMGEPKRKVPFRLANGKEVQASMSTIVNDYRIHRVLDHNIRAAQQGGLIGLFCVTLLFPLMFFLVTRTGSGMRRIKRLRGGQLVKARELAHELRSSRRASKVKIASVPLLKGTETSHILLSGSPGSGKSLGIRDILDGVRKRGDRAIVYSTSGEFIRDYYREGNDVILNPLDDRCPSWNIWADCQTPTDYDQVAASLIPESRSSSDPFWTKAAQILFATIARRVGNRLNPTTPELLDALLKTDLTELGKLLEGTEAAPLVEKDVEKTALSIKATMATYARSLKYLRDETKTEGQKPFSIRDWIRDESSDDWIFMASRSDQKDALRPLITMWMDIAAATLLSLEPRNDRRIWIVIDELPSLNRLPSLQALQAEGRKYGACAVLGFQSFSQLCEIYGRHGADTMTGLCSSWVIYRANEPVTAEWCAKSIGSVENIEPNEALSYGANTMRDGVNLSQPRQVRSLVMPSEIQNLPNRHGYIRLPGDLPIAQFEIPYRPRPQVAEEFIPIELDKTCLEVCV